jgi:hypothetical protein
MFIHCTYDSNKDEIVIDAKDKNNICGKLLIMNNTNIQDTTNGMIVYGNKIVRENI